MNKALSLALLFALSGVCACNSQAFNVRTVAASGSSIEAYTLDTETDSLYVSDTVARGSTVLAIDGMSFRRGGTGYSAIVRAKGEPVLYVPSDALCDSTANPVLETRIFVRTPASVISDTLASTICDLADKGAELKVLGYNYLMADGRVNRYYVETARGTCGWVFGKYIAFSKEDALKRYKPEYYDAHAIKVRNPFGGGQAIGCDYYPSEKPVFEDNVMPDACYSLYLNFSPVGLRNIESYIDLAKQTSINTFVIDIKDDTCPGFKADAMRKWSPTNYSHAGSDKAELYRHAVQRLHEEGFYVVARITCFKDAWFVKDNPGAAIIEKSTGKPLYHNKSYWPSAFDRSVWMFNVELAKEAVVKFGFDEINFDYVRFPDRMTSVENLIDYHNRYGESKVQAIQRFVTYACDEIHRVGAYVSIDTFGESASPEFTTAYGQYWPALSNVVDVMCGMPYPDHFASGSFGIEKPWNSPYQTLKAWGKRVVIQQKYAPTPAKVRTWVQAYHVMRYVDPEGIDYNAANIEKEIRGLYDAGLTDGYTTWLASGSLERYRTLAPAFVPDYLKEYREKNGGN